MSQDLLYYEDLQCNLKQVLDRIQETFARLINDASSLLNQ
uniref:Uncharacterized protein n=1 Tax=Gloeothece verrucosa (strain PCC 7822) TaxID=497965 RepID=E0U861_GLOV7|nr:hypothetical protein Cyan7822_5389 [Gloeothece verrucosa PCC 7822]